MNSTDGSGPLEDALRECAALLETGDLPDEDELRRRYGSVADELIGCLDALAGVRAGIGLTSPDPGPTALGDFRLLREVGRGGMGVVYEAEQISLGRRVALKMLPFVAALDPRQILRFKQEVTAAALLHHPHIVPVFSVGAERGVHYYAMQLIDGRPLSALIAERVRGAAPPDAPTLKRADTSRPSLEWWRQAARQIADAADALEHAHAHGVVHRDIKPANLLLDGEGKLWVTDFGLARLQSDSGLTRTGDLVGTARYMSPEQALGRVGMDHRTDVYSLGVTLYELLTLRPAFPDPEREALLRRIPLDDPPAPRALVPGLPLDLETVVLKSIAKDPDSRYESAAAFAADLRRWLADEAVQARRPTLAQQMGRWGRRHRTLVRASLVFLGLALIGLSVAVGLLLRAWHGESVARAAAVQRTLDLEAQMKRTDEARLKAFRNADRGWDAVESMYVQGGRLFEQVPGQEEVQRAFFERAGRAFEQLLAERGDRPQDRQRLVRVFTLLALIRERLADAPGMLEAAREAVAHSDDPGRSSSAAFHALGRALLTHGDHAGARTALREALLRVPAGETSELLADRQAIHHSLATLDPPDPADVAAVVALTKQLLDLPDRDPRHLITVARLLANLAPFEAKAGRSDAAEALARRAAGVLDELDRQPDLVHVQHRERLEVRADVLHTLAGILHVRGDPEAKALVRQDLAVRERLAADFPLVPNYRMELCLALHAVAASSRKAGDLTEAERQLARARDLLKRLVADHPDRRNYAVKLGQNWMSLASTLSVTDRQADVIAAVREAVTVREEAVRRWTDPEMVGLLAEARIELGTQLSLKGETAEAKKALRAGLALVENCPLDALESDVSEALAKGLGSLAFLSSRDNDLSAARKEYGRAIEIDETLIRASPGKLAMHWRLGAHRNGLAVVLRKLSRPAAARAEAEAAAALLNQVVLLAPDGLTGRPPARMRSEAAKACVGLSEARTDPAGIVAALVLAAEHQRRAVALAPGDESRDELRKILARLADAHFVVADATAAGVIADEASELNWHGAAKAGFVHARRMDAERMRACFAKAADFAGDDEQTLTTLVLAMALQITGPMRDAKAALSLAERAVAVAPASASAWVGMAASRLAAGDAAKAKEALAEARKRVKGPVAIIEYLSAVALAKGGDVAEGRKVFERIEKARGTAVLTGATLYARNEAVAALGK